MNSGTSAAGSARLVAMIFAVSLSSTATQWIVNGYLLSLAALFMLGGKLADVVGHRRILVVGVATALLARGRVEETEPVATATSAA
jgi:MFS family permease